MGYGRGNIGTGMHLEKRRSRGFTHSGSQRKEISQNSAASRRKGAAPLGSLLKAEIADNCLCDDDGLEENMQVFEGGDLFASSRNITAGIVSKLSGVPVDEIIRDTRYQIEGVSHCPCFAFRDEDPDFDWWSVHMPILYDLETHNGASAVSVVTGTVDCSLFDELRVNDDDDYIDSRMEWHGPSDLLSGISGLMHVYAEGIARNNVMLRPPRWLLNAFEGTCLSGGGNRELASQFRIECLANLVVDVTKTICDRIESQGYCIVQLDDLPPNVKFRNLQD